MDWVMLAFNVVCATCSLCWPYVYCHFATMTTERIASIGNAAYSANWYGYPATLRKHVILMIVCSQEELFFSGFGFVYCTLEILLKVNDFLLRSNFFMIIILFFLIYVSVLSITYCCSY